MKTNYRWSAGALGTIHESGEHFLITLLENANLCAIHAKHVTVSVNDVQLVIKMLDLKKNFKTDESVTNVPTQAELDDICREEEKKKHEIEDWRMRARDRRAENLQQQIEDEEEQVAAARAKRAQEIKKKKEKKLEEAKNKRKNRIVSDNDSTSENKSKWRKRDENEQNEEEREEQEKLEREAKEKKRKEQKEKDRQEEEEREEQERLERKRKKKERKENRTSERLLDKGNKHMTHVEETWLRDSENWMRNAEGRDYGCPECGVWFFTSAAVHVHLDNEHSSHGDSENGNGTNDIPENAQRRPSCYGCTHCTQSFYSERLAVDHMKTHTERDGQASDGEMRSENNEQTSHDTM